MSNQQQNTVNSKTINGPKLVKLETGQLPPQAIDLERVVLGAMMIDTDIVDEINTIISTPNVFYTKQHQAIFEAITMLVVNMKPVDLLTVSEQLRFNGKLEIAGGSQYIVQLSQLISSTAHTEYHSRILMQKYVSREVIKLANSLIGRAYDDETDVIELLAESSNDISGIQDLMISGTRQMSMSEALEKVAKRVEFLTNKEEGAITGVTCGLSKVDEFTSGWQPGSYVTIGARPGMGKTSFLVGNMVGASKQKVATGFISLEMSTVELVGRAVAVDSHFHLSQLLTKGFEKPSYFEQLQQVTDRMKTYNCHFNDEVTDISDILSVARKWKRDNNIGILFIDYLQLISDRSYKGSMREQEISSITRKIKLLAKELKIPIIVPAQLSRKVEDRGGAKRPLLSDLRESGAIEQDSDIVAFLYRPEVYGIDTDDDQDMVDQNCNSELIFSKFRAGGTGTVLLYWKGDKTRFYNHSYIEQSHQDISQHAKGADQAFEIPNNEAPF
jgi:replicative DNA helicase